MATAVEEFVPLRRIHSRHSTDGDQGGRPRWAEPMSGQSVMVNYASANRDDREFPDARPCILDRASNRHLGFGAGVHRCLGSNLARLEFRIGVEQVLARMPDYTVAPMTSRSFMAIR